MLDWNANRRISVVTLDNCFTSDVMVDRLIGLIEVDFMLMGGDYFHMGCVAHILNLIVKEGMKVRLRSGLKILGIVCLTG